MDPEVDSRPARFWRLLGSTVDTSLCVRLRRPNFSVMLGSTVDTSLCVRLRRPNFSVMLGYAWFNSGYKFMRQNTEAGFPGFNTPRTVFLPCLQAGDARHHGQYGPEGQFYARCSSSSRSSSFPVAAQSLVPMVHTVLQTMRFHDCSSSTWIIMPGVESHMCLGWSRQCSFCGVPQLALSWTGC